MKMIDLYLDISRLTCLDMSRQDGQRLHVHLAQSANGHAHALSCDHARLVGSWECMFVCRVGDDCKY